MCRSVPQIAVFSSLIRTSFGPGAGTGTSSIQMPLAASRLTSAFIICVMATGSFAGRELYAPGPQRPVASVPAGRRIAQVVVECVEVRAIDDLAGHAPA